MTLQVEGINNARASLMNTKILIFLSHVAAVLLFSLPNVLAQANQDLPLVITADKFADDSNVATDKLVWKYRAGDEAAWDAVKGASISSRALPASGWNGRAWFRLKFRIDEAAASKNLSIIVRHFGASEVFLDGRLLAAFGEIGEGRETEYNPNYIPVPFDVEAGEHVFAVRYSGTAFGDLSGWRAEWLERGSARPGFILSVREIKDFKATVQAYADRTTMRIPFLFAGVLFALALIHLLLFVFYRVEQANLFYGIYAFAFGLSVIVGNLQSFVHSGANSYLIARVITLILFSVMFVALLAFLHTALARPFNFIFWTIALLWLVSAIFGVFLLNNFGSFAIVPNITMFFYFSYSIYLLVQALRERRAGAWILFVGVQIFAAAMLLNLLSELNIFRLSGGWVDLQQIAVVLGVPVAVSVFLARNFAVTNRNLTERLEEVKELSERQIEQERHASELRIENERHAKELEEARQLQLSMLPKKLPQISNLKIAAYMKPASEVGGDYYDFHTGADGTLTVAVGDATGHGLKAGTVVTAAKALFKNYADEADIPDVFKKSSRVIKEMNLRGLFMAMTIVKIKENRAVICAAGMPSPLVFRRASGRVEEINLRAMPWGSPFAAEYKQSEVTLDAGDAILLMSDGFPEMFNGAGEILGFDKAALILPDIAAQSPQEIINHLVQTGERWANGRPQDDDVTFVVLKVGNAKSN